ncbi:hypothetical protein CTAYLR_006859 [Chrysophaeum taylorii]|uniref:DNA topoisomerase n=1 Tax=Chrysophaeum taylorii TaxID=2483200 RepID=A0AAD7XHE5_9STRA|nr:hypothetical protein CTAYLR_006859 [Chrysophaeum taylorii]
MAPRRRRVLHVAEKPSVAKSLAQTLSGGRLNSRQGPSQYNRLYEFERAGPVGNEECFQVVTSVTGHLMSTEFEAPFNKWHNCSVRDVLCEDVARVKWIVPEERKPLEQQLLAEARSARALVLWLDCDLEGEAIAFEVVEVCTRANSRLDLWRAKFSSLDAREVDRAWRSLGRPDKNKSDAVCARSELDLRAGAAFTRWQTFRIQGRYSGLNDSLVSYGPCQFPTLGFVVERQNEIDAHVPRDFWRIELETTTPADPRAPGSEKAQRKITVRWTWRRKRLFDRLPAVVLFELCREAAALRIESVDAKPATRTRPLPLQTVELQKRASRWLRMSSSEIMDVAESLYQRGYVSYPRTETDFFKDSCDLKLLLHEQRNDHRWGAHVARLLDDPPGAPTAFEWPRKGNKDDEAHPPVHPTKGVARGELQNRKEEQVYELIARHFIACCSRDARGRQTNVLATLSQEAFDARGLVVDQRNFLDVYVYEKWNGVDMPRFDAGVDLDVQTTVSRLDLAQSATEPPRGLTEADLLAKMDHHGIGTDATMADHIKTVLAREYATKDAGSGVFRPMPLGRALVDAYDAMGERLNRPDLRAKLEADVAQIAAGAKRRDDVVRDALVTMRRCFDTVTNDAAKLDAAMHQHFANGGGSVARGRPPGRRRPPRGSSDDDDDGNNNNNDNNDNDAGGDVPDPSGFAFKCGSCGATMRLYVREVSDDAAGRKRRFSLRCDSCTETLGLPDRAERFEIRSDRCVLCGFNAIQVHEAYKSYAICPRCVRQPPRGAKFNGGDFKCGDCTADGCPLASGIKGGTIPVCQCYKCNDRPMFVVRANNGKLNVDCAEASCGARIRFPDAVASAKVLDSNQCARCSDRSPRPSLRLELRLQSAKVPPGTLLNPRLCVLCDTEVMSELDITRTTQRAPPQLNGINRGGRCAHRPPAGPRHGPRPAGPGPRAAGRARAAGR